MDTPQSVPEAYHQAKALIQRIKTGFIREDGLLARNYPVQERTLFDNFDDVVPFFLYFDEAPFLLNQIRILREQHQSLVSLCAQDGMLITNSIDEWFGGLHALWQATGDAATYSLLEESVDFMVTHLMKDGFLSAALYVSNYTTAPCYEPWSSGLLETFCEMRKAFPAAFEQAQQVLRNWLRDDYFQRYGLFPYRVYTSPRKRSIQNIVAARFFPRQRYSTPPILVQHPGIMYRVPNMVQELWFYMTQNSLYSQLMKSNSTCAFTLLEFYRVTGDTVWIEHLITWIRSALRYFYDGQTVYMEVVPKTGARRDPLISAAFILVDVLCDTLYFARDALTGEADRLVHTAKTILDHAWERRLDNGLLPWSEGATFAHIDSQVDFAISLRRYAELCEEPAYARRSAELTERVIRVHESPDGFCTYSGDVAENVIDPKYNALLLKGFINLLTMDSPLYPMYYALFKDR